MNGLEQQKRQCNDLGIELHYFASNYQQQNTHFVIWEVANVQLFNQWLNPTDAATGIFPEK